MLSKTGPPRKSTCAKALISSRQSRSRGTPQADSQYPSGKKHPGERDALRELWIRKRRRPQVLR